MSESSALLGAGALPPKVTWALARAPLLAFISVYLVTCALGAALMLLNWRPFVDLFEYFSGTPVATVTGSELAINLILLVAAPFFLWCGYEYALRRRLEGTPGAELVRRLVGKAELRTPSWLPQATFYAAAALAVASVRRGDSFGNLSSWLDYEIWIEARAQTFLQLSFFEFVNIYLVVPMAAAWTVVTERGNGTAAFARRWLPLLVTLCLGVLLFQKKTAIVSLLLILFAWLLFRGRRDLRRTGVAAVATVLAAGSLYLATVVVPVFSTSGDTVCGVETVECNWLTEKVPAVVLYSAMSPFVRTSAPALYYPVIYPRDHDFYGLDVGQDILGFGSFPDDNLVVWRRMNPDRAGTTVVPFHFTLYSQAGVFGALLGSLVVGFLLGIAWRLARHPLVPREWSSLLGSLLIMFGIYVAIDSLRNSTVVSYGLGWGLAFVVAAAVFVHVLNTKPKIFRRPLSDRVTAGG